MTENQLSPNYIFEASWEVCNKVGGIYTVISTKAKTLANEFKDNYILLGPDVWKEISANPEFIEDKFLFRSWREQAESEGLKFRIGRWNIAGNPVVILVDFTPYFPIKDKIFFEFWEEYKLDSLSGQWDYVEPAMFGYASAKIIESFYNFSLTSKDKIIAHFHEWMTGTGILYLKKYIPQAGTLFTTHATAVGRSIAGNGLPLYQKLSTFNGDEFAKNFGIAAKQSLEKITANQSDCYTTVSEITARECSQFHLKDVDIITPNGFEDSFVPDDLDFQLKREAARNKLFNVAEALLNQKISRDSLLVANSGRYEFKNKGIDLYIDALGKLNNQSDLNKDILAFIMVPANNLGPRTDVIERIHNCNFNEPISDDYLTHWMPSPENDPSIIRIKANNLRNSLGSKVKIIFVPVYLNGEDGIFNMQYYDLLIGFDITVFPSYYEPWGYTPLESLAFHIPTVTTTLAGFGAWVKSFYGDLKNGMAVIDRNDYNDREVVNDIAEYLQVFCNKSKEELEQSREKAFYISRTALWANLVNNYKKAFSIALEKVSTRSNLFKNKRLPDNTSTINSLNKNKPVWKKVLVKSYIPEDLFILQRIARNLWWSWNFEAQELFEMIDPKLWQDIGRNPIILLEILSYEQYLELEKNADFMGKLARVSQQFNTYMSAEKPKDKIAYFSMEFGLHDTIKIYSGGLGVLAGDYLKEASDSNYNIVGVGLLYRYGYFNQSLSPHGEQVAGYAPQKFSNMPVLPVRNENGEWVTISVSLPGRTLWAKVWRIDVGRIPLYLLDTDIEENSEADRSITYQLYGGDIEHRLKQEILLGIGGIRMLKKLDIKPSLYHCNEGHAAFIGLERLRKMIDIEKLSFSESVELVRASTLFTTHTPVPAGHDAFSENLIRTYLSHFAARLNITWSTFMSLGKVNEEDPLEKFSMSVLASRLSQEINAVSRIHGRVTREMFNEIWDGFYPEELHIDYVTNGVHFPTWVAKRWFDLYKNEFGENFLQNQSEKSHWAKIHNVSDKIIWDIRQLQRKDLFDAIKNRLTDNLENRQENPTLVMERVEALNDKVLTIGFARRFATYKRAHLIFRNLKKLSEIVNNKQFPVQFVFAGKAHPNDKGGQDLIKYIVEISKQPEFIGKITFLENYDMDLAKKLVQGVDIWLNTPTRPLEASGTSGEKAIMNGVVNFSVLDGWWAEGYVPGAGWALKEKRTYENQEFQDELDAETIYNILENEIIPAFYSRNEEGVPEKWILHVKNTISEIAPNFTMKRMLDDYIRKFYVKMLKRSEELRHNDFELARDLASWKKKIERAWESIEVISVNLPDSTVKPLLLGDKFKAQIILNLHELSCQDIGIEIIFGQKVFDEVKEIYSIEELHPVECTDGNVSFTCELPATRSGVYDYSFRIFPKNNLLPHRQDFALLKWI